MHPAWTTPLCGALRCVSVGIRPGQFSRWGLLPHAPCQPGVSPVSALTRVPPPAVHRAAARRSSLRFGRNTLGPVLPVGAPPSRALSSQAPRRYRRLRHLIHRLPTQKSRRHGSGSGTIGQPPEAAGLQLRRRRFRTSTACGETPAAFERRCIPAEPRRFAALGVAFRSKYTRYSSLTRLVSRAPPRSRRSPGFHHKLLNPARGYST